MEKKDFFRRKAAAVSRDFWVKNLQHSVHPRRNYGLLKEHDGESDPSHRGARKEVLLLRKMHNVTPCEMVTTRDCETHTTVLPSRQNESDFYDFWSSLT